MCEELSDEEITEIIMLIDTEYQCYVDPETGDWYGYDSNGVIIRVSAEDAVNIPF